MPAPEPTIGRSEFDVLVKRSGLPLNEEQKARFHQAFGFVEAMAARVRQDGKRPREAEPALVFKPTER